MAAVIAPWLHLPNFVGAASSGAASGLGIRKANQEATDAADRLTLAYDTLASNERRAADDERAKMELAHASLALRGQQMDAMQAYHQGQLEARDANMQRLASQFGEREDRMKQQFSDNAANMADRFETRMQARETAADALQKRFEDNQARLERNSASSPGKLSPADYLNAQADTEDLRVVRKRIAEIDKAGGPARGRFWLTEGTTKEYPELKAKEKELRDKLSSYQTPRQAAQAGEPDYASEEDAITGVDSSAAPYVWDPQTRRIKKVGQ